MKYNEKESKIKKVMKAAEERVKVYEEKIE